MSGFTTGPAAGRNSRPVTVRGEVFPSQKAVAQRFNLSGSLVSRMIRQGRTDEIGALARFHRQGGARYPVEVRGLRYASQTEAARALGVDPSTLRDALDRGAQDRVGQGRARR